jgi:excisionase family DNA binding protein
MNSKKVSSKQTQFAESGTSPTAEPADFSFRGALNIPQAAVYTGVRCSAIEEAVRDGRLPGRKLGRNIIILKSDLDAFLAALDIIPAHTPPSILKRRRERLEGKVAA